MSELVQQVNSLETKVECLTYDASRKAESLKKVEMEKNLLVQSSVVAARLQFNHGKLYDDVQERQKQRKVKTIKTAIEQALFFLQCFGFLLDKIVLRSTEKHEVVNLNYLCPPATGSESEEDEDDLPDSVKETLYLLERFGVSDECYHELAMLHPQLPRLYKIKNARRDITLEIELLPLPAKNGAYRPLKNCLSLVLSRKLQDQELLSSVQVKFSGDGASFSRNATYELLSFSFPSLCDDALAGTGNHTFAAVKCTENYDNLKQALEPVLADMNELIEAQEIEVEGKIIKLEIRLGGDMKFLLVVLGMNAAH